MRNIVTFFAFVLLAATAQSQSLAQKEITGTWFVVNVENSNRNPKMAAAMDNVLINFYADNSFEIKEKQENGKAHKYTTTSNKGATWSYDESNQTISTTHTKMTLLVSKNDNKVFFTDKESGLRFEVVKPI